MIVLWLLAAVAVFGGCEGDDSLASLGKDLTSLKVVSLRTVEGVVTVGYLPSAAGWVDALGKPVRGPEVLRAGNLEIISGWAASTVDPDDLRKLSTRVADKLGAEAVVAKIPADRTRVVFYLDGKVANERMSEREPPAVVPIQGTAMAPEPGKDLTGALVVATTWTETLPASKGKLTLAWDRIKADLRAEPGATVGADRLLAMAATAEARGWVRVEGGATVDGTGGYGPLLVSQVIARLLGPPTLSSPGQRRDEADDLLKYPVREDVDPASLESGLDLGVDRRFNRTAAVSSTLKIAS